MVAVLFVRRDSDYKAIPGVDCFDIDRDARSYDGPAPVVANPPCRAWSRLRHFAKPRPDEKDLALFALDRVRRFGGVLEHPESSALWREASLPPPGAGVDGYGGYSFPVPQFWFGHRAMKKTWLYIVGCAPGSLPTIPLILGDAPCTVGLFSGRDRVRARKEVSKREREATPLPFAHWLIETAKRCAL